MKKATSNQVSRERGALIYVSAYVDELERDERFRTISIRDEKINGNGNIRYDLTALLFNDKERDNIKVWVSEAKIVDNYEGHTLVVEGQSRRIVDYCGYRDDENGTGKNLTQSFFLSSTIRDYVKASREALRSYLLGGRYGIYNTEKSYLTTTSTSTNTNNDVAY